MSLGITKGEWPALGIAPLSHQYFDDGTVILDAIHTVARAANIDFWIDYNRKAHVATQRGINNESTLDYGQRVTSVSRSFSHEAYANYLRMTGAQPGVAVRISAQHKKRACGCRQ